MLIKSSGQMHKIIYSLSLKPGIFGSNLYNFIFKKFDIPYIYKASAIQSSEVMNDVLNVFQKTDMIYAMSISMPYKSFSYNFLKAYKGFKSIQEEYKSVNSLKKSNSSIIGSLTDIYILEEFYKSFICTNRSIEKVYIIGKGVMAKLSANYLKNFNMEIIFLNRNFNSDLILKINNDKSSCLINATPLNLDEIIPYKNLKIPTLDFPVRINIVIDNPLVLSGYNATKIQFMHQFMFYTGISINLRDINESCNYLFKKNL
tara:strand:- start:4073 stop:4849 length:777 start_codon:yes stop_codon:yes gene_type:complete